MSGTVKRVNYLFHEMDAVYHEIALGLGLSDSAFLILYAICNDGDSCLLSDITGMTGVSKQTINSALRKLESEGILYLETFQGRKKRICLTDDGKEYVGNTVTRVIKMENDIYDSWSERDREMYLQLTQRYLTALKEKKDVL